MRFAKISLIFLLLIFVYFTQNPLNLSSKPKLCPYSNPENLRFIENASTPPPLLASVPGSGNTWLRHLLQLATGIHTGSIYGNPEMTDNGFPGERRSYMNKTLVVKNHLYGPMKYENISTTEQIQRPLEQYRNETGKWFKAVVIVRNPIDGAIAEFNRQRGYIGSGINKLAPVKTFREKDAFLEFLHRYVTFWDHFHKYILRTFPSEEKLCVIKYENLLSDLENTLKPCLKFLGYPLDSIGEFCLENENLEGNFHRPRRKPEEINEIMQLIPKAKWQEYEEIWSQNLANLLESSYKIK